MKRLTLVLAAAAVTAALASATAIESTGTPAPAAPAVTEDRSGPATTIEMPRERLTGPFAVTRVVDGDTIWVDHGGTREKVRLVGVDTPETVDPRKGVQCFGIAASDHTKELLGGQSVFLETDSSQSPTDKYGRALAYVWLDGRLVNLDLIANGFAHEYTYDVPYRYRDQFRAAETEARTHQRGLWSPATCDGNTKQSGR